MKEHHNPDGMIALCALHHPQADAGAFTVEQLRKFKADAAAASPGDVAGKFGWLRRRVLVCVGGNFYFETYVIFQYRETPIVWLSRDADGYLLLNLHSLTASGEPRLAMEENFWTVHGNQEDLECPPSGRLIRVRYPNGDQYAVEFLELQTQDDIRKRYPSAHKMLYEIETPIVSVEVTFKVANSSIDFGPRHSTFGQDSRMGGNFAAHAAVGFVLN